MDRCPFSIFCSCGTNPESITCEILNPQLMLGRGFQVQGQGGGQHAGAVHWRGEEGRLFMGQVGWWLTPVRMLTRKSLSRQPLIENVTSSTRLVLSVANLQGAADAGANADAKRTSLSCAQGEAVAKLVECGADLNAASAHGWTALHIAAKVGGAGTTDRVEGRGVMWRDRSAYCW